MSLKRKAVFPRLKVAGCTRNRMNQLNRTVGGQLHDIEEPPPIGIQRAHEMVHRLKRHRQELKITGFHSDNVNANAIHGPTAGVPDADAEERHAGVFLKKRRLRCLERDLQLPFQKMLKLEVIPLPDLIRSQEKGDHRRRPKQPGRRPLPLSNGGYEREEYRCASAQQDHPSGFESTQVFQEH